MLIGVGCDLNILNTLYEEIIMPKHLKSKVQIKAKSLKSNKPKKRK